MHYLSGEVEAGKIIQRAGNSMGMRPFVTPRKKVTLARTSDAHMLSCSCTRQNTGQQKRIGWIRAALLNINSEFPVAPSNNEGSDAPFGNRLMPDEPL